MGQHLQGYSVCICSFSVYSKETEQMEDAKVLKKDKVQQLTYMYLIKV